MNKQKNRNIYQTEFINGQSNPYFDKNYNEYEKYSRKHKEEKLPNVFEEFFNSLSKEEMKSLTK